MAGVKATTPKLPLVKTVPDFVSEEQAAGWYNTHDLFEVGHELVPTESGETNDGAELEDVVVRLPRVEIDELAERARPLGVDHRTYVRLLVNRHLLSEEPIA